MVEAGTFNNLNQLQSLAAGGEALLQGSLNEPGTVVVGSGSTRSDGENNFRLRVPVTTGTNQLIVVSKDVNGNASTNTATFTVTNSGTQAFAYDLNGNTTTDGLRTYSWDGANRLVRITYSSTSNYTEFTYDGAGRRVRIQEVESGTVSSDRRLVWDGMSIAELRAADGTTVQKRFFDAGFQVTGTSGADEYFYVRDHLGSVRSVIDENEVERGRWNFGIWGERGSSLITSNPVESDFGFTGHYMHERSGLVVAPFRIYNPSVGRWISRDLIEERDGFNLYAYVAEDPLNRIDPLGLAATVTDDFGATCCMSMMVEWEIRVQSPPIPVVSQILENVRAGKAMLNSIASGHVFIVTAGDTGYGFYPNKFGDWRGKPGAMSKSDKDHPYNYAKKIKVCPSSRTKMGEFLDKTISDQPIYDIDGLNCTTWVLEMLRSAGASMPDVMEPYFLARTPGFESAR